MKNIKVCYNEVDVIYMKVGDIIKCEVSGITEYGVFVNLDNGYSGLIHISQISGKFISNIDKLYIIGDVVTAKIIEIDEEKKQVKLSIKDNEVKKKKKKVIEEKGQGFKPLKEKLDFWVKEKLKELEKNSKTP